MWYVLKKKKFKKVAKHTYTMNQAVKGKIRNWIYLKDYLLGNIVWVISGSSLIQFTSYKSY